MSPRSRSRPSEATSPDRAGRVVPGARELAAHEAEGAVALPRPGAAVAEEVEDDGDGDAGGEDGGAEPAEDAAVQAAAAVAAVPVAGPGCRRLTASPGDNRRRARS